MSNETQPTGAPGFHADGTPRTSREELVAMANAARTQVPPQAGEPFESYAARVQAHFQTERPPKPIRSIAEASRLNGISAKDPKYTRARFDADLAVTNVEELPERLTPPKTLP